jgi:hypothetical protein
MGHSLATLLNGHPDDGIGKCEENYTAFAKAIGADPGEGAKFACNMSSEGWVGALFETMLAPKGVNYWWTDYGGCAPPSPNLLPLVWSAGCPTAHQFAFDTQQLLWSNYVYDSALQATGVRPLVLSRYGGIGNQRHGIGFSGDTQATWSTLKLQVAMTSTAANVLFGYWSHDLGGYNIYCPSNGTISPCKCGTVVQPCNITTGQCGKAPSELYLRWLQFGTFSPIFRSHCSHCDRRIWAYPEADFLRMRTAMRFRHALRPYVYTAARTAFDTHIMTVHPLYYDWPDLEAAYIFSGSQYLFGEALMVAPVTEPLDPLDTSAGESTARTFWIPPGTWSFWNASHSFTGPLQLALDVFGLDEFPVFARAGAVLPTFQATNYTDMSTAIWIVFANAAGSGALYEDEGNTTAYKTEPSLQALLRVAQDHSHPKHLGGRAHAGSASWTYLSHNATHFSISAVQRGNFAGASVSRRHALQLRNSAVVPPSRPSDATVTITCNGAVVPFSQPPATAEDAYSQVGWWIVPASMDAPWLTQGSVIIVLPVMPLEEPIKVALHPTNSPSI